ncbi:MAG: response regulator [Cyanobacteria bacterium P01_E01_bin.45]
MTTPRFTFSDSSSLLSSLQHMEELYPTGVWQFYPNQPSSAQPSSAQPSSAQPSSAQLSSAQPSSKQPLPPAAEPPVYLGVAQGKFIYASKTSILSWVACLEILQRSLPKLRSASARQHILQIENSVSREQQALLGSMLNKLVGMRLLGYEDARRAFLSSILVAIEHLLEWEAGYAEFTPNYELVAAAPVQGFGLDVLNAEIDRRQAKWRQLKPTVPSMAAIPVLNVEALQTANLPQQQQERLSALLSHRHSLGQLATRLGKDPLIVANTFSGLIQQQLVSLQLATTPSGAESTSVPQVFVVDDSPVLIRQFVKLVTHWGYRVQHSSDATTAVAAIAEARPDTIFLDINMPGATGFDLIKQIRRTPDIASTPIVLLTAENSVSNKWRAQWANCQFLAKPAVTSDVSGFREELHAMLREMAAANHLSPDRVESMTQSSTTQRQGSLPTGQLETSHPIP